MKDKTDKVTQELPLDDRYIVYYKGKPTIKLSARLSDEQNLSDDTVEAIKQLHVERMIVEDVISDKSTTPEMLKLQFKIWTSLQFSLQKCWGFPEDIKFHKFWEVPRCECPTIDNYDAYPTGYYSTNLSCPVHGDR